MSENKVRLHALQQARDYVNTAKTGIMLAFHGTDAAHLYEEHFDELLHELDVDIVELTPPVAPRWYVFDEADCFDNFATATAAAICAEHLLAMEMRCIEIKLLSTKEFEDFMQGKH